MAGPSYHGRTHSTGGTDPIPGLGATTHLFGAGWTGPYPLNILTGAVWKVPLVDEVSTTFDLTRALFRLETPGTTSTVVRIEKSSGGGAFSGSPTTITTLTLTSGSYETTDTTGLGSVTSGDLLRIVWVSVGTNARGFLVAVEGTES